MKILLLLIMVLISSSSTDQTEEIDEACNCDHCLITNDQSALGVLPINNLNPDRDGISEICARGRDLPDREFDSVCHMLCYNRCTRWRSTEILDSAGVKSLVAVAYRTNYYKLRKGTCKKS